MRLSLLLFFASAVCICSQSEMAQADFDLSPTWSGVSGSPIVTHGFSDNTSTFSPPGRVFDFVFDDPSSPDATGDPGFHALAVGSPELPAGSGLKNGDNLTFGIVSNLLMWTGSSFGPAPAGVTLSLLSERDPNLTVPTVATGAQTFVIGTVGPPYGDQSIHEHLTSVLNGLNNSHDGIYAFEMTLQMANDPNVAASLPFVVLYNHLSNRFDLINQSLDPNDDPQVQAAIGYAEANLVPEPAGWILAGLGGVLVIAAKLGRRRHAGCCLIA